VTRSLRNMFRYRAALLLPRVGMSGAIVTNRTSLRQLRDYGLPGRYASKTDVSRKSASGKLETLLGPVADSERVTGNREEVNRAQK
jgi:hypothetical protein